MLQAICWIVGIAAVVYLAVREKEGWGWIIFILACTGVPSGSVDLKETSAQIESLEKEMSELRLEVGRLTLYSGDDTTTKIVVSPKEENLVIPNKDDSW